LVLKKNASIGKVNNKLCIYKGGNLTNEKSVVVGTVTISVSIARWIANVRIFIIALVIICLITCLICSICYVYIPDFYRNAYAYLKATKVIYKARKERKERLKEQRQQTKNVKKESLDGFKEELEKNDIEENVHKEETESIEENVQEKEIENIEEKGHEEEIESIEEKGHEEEIESIDDKPKSVKREVKEGEEDHPVMDWIVDQLK
jgi:flagellar biosynthesis GTPase FlhF